MIKKTFIFSLTLLLLSLNSVTVKAQPLNQDFQTWGNVTTISSLDRSNSNSNLDNFKLWLEGQGRFGQDSSRFSQGILRTGLGYYFRDNISLWLGYAWIPNNPSAPRSNFDEHRIWQQLLWTEKFSDGKFMSRTRLEQRFDDRGDDVGWRYRQFFKYQHPFGFEPKLSWVVWDEVFVVINKTDWKPDNGFDQNRAFVGLGYQFNQNIRSELGYINQFIENSSTADAMNHILSVNLFLKF